MQKVRRKIKDYEPVTYEIDKYVKVPLGVPSGVTIKDDMYFRMINRIIIRDLEKQYKFRQNSDSDSDFSEDLDWNEEIRFVSATLIDKAPNNYFNSFNNFEWFFKTIYSRKLGQRFVNPLGISGPSREGRFVKGTFYSMVNKFMYPTKPYVPRV